MARKTLPPRLESFNGVWYVYFAEDGRSRRTSLRTDDLSVAQARFQGWLKERESYQAAKKAPTFAFAHQLYVEQHSARTASPESLEFVGKPLKAFFGGMRLEEISSKHVRDYIEQRRKGMRVVNDDGSKEKRRPVSDGTIRKELTIMRAVFNFMVTRVEPKELRADPRELCYIEMPSRPAPRQRVLSNEELDVIRKAVNPPAPPATMPRISLYVWLLMETGARAGALRDLTWQQIDFTNGFIRLNPYGRNQTKKRRPIVPISNELRPILERAYQERTNDYVLAHAGQIRKSFERLVARLGLEEVTAHTFRHTFATHLAQNGVSMIEIGQLLGDSLTTVEKNYLHYQPEYLRQAINSLSLRRTSEVPTGSEPIRPSYKSADALYSALNDAKNASCAVGLPNKHQTTTPKPLEIIAPRV
jgi:integrase